MFRDEANTWKKVHCVLQIRNRKFMLDLQHTLDTHSIPKLSNGEGLDPGRQSPLRRPLEPLLASFGDEW